ncbi:MAG TPA: BON domain-containing protein, partial [Chryseosolibacter sp.]
RILEDINDLMCDNAYLDASEIEVAVSEGNVVLSGTVENRESKRLAEDIAESVSGVQNVENTLRVTKKGI